MKKTLALSIVAVLLFACMFSLVACNNSKIVGVYEMTDISGSMTYNGTTTRLTRDLYEYYTIEVKKDGTAIVKAKGSGAGQYIENKGTWTEEDGVIKLKSTQGGFTVVEEMKWDNGVITYSNRQSANGVSVNMTIVLAKKA